MRLRLIPIAALLLAMVSCGNVVPPDVDKALEDAADIQGLLPALEASHALVRPEEPAAGPAPFRTIFPTNAGAGFPATPADLWALRASGATVARFPAAGYILDFYGEQGNEAYVELRESTDLTGGYQVSLYIYPVLSAAVWYTLEQYRVTADTWLNIVGADGQPDATAYQKWETRYFDGRVESRALVWSRYTDDPQKVYVQADLALPGSFTSAFNFPVTPPQPARVTPAAEGDFSSESSSVIPPAKGTDPHTVAAEFYNQIVITNGFLKQSRSYVTDTYRNGTVQTVRMYKADTTSGDKTVMARSSGLFDRGPKEWTTAADETISITGGGGSAVSYESTVVTSRAGTVERTVTVSVAETAAGSNMFQGSATIQTPKGTTVRIVSMDAGSGVDIGTGTPLPLSIVARELVYPVNVETGADAPELQTRDFSIEGLTNGGSFSGAYVGGVLDGTYTGSDGTTYDMTISRLVVEVDGEAY